MRLPLWRLRQNQELDEEIQAHLREAIRERVESGESEAEAERAVLREFGNVELVKEVTREMWGWTAVDSWVRDLCFGFRQLRRNLGFTAAAVLTLALGIGVNTAIFSYSYADGLLFRPLAVREPERLVTPFHITKDGDNYSSFSLPDYRDFREQNIVLSGLAAYSDFEASIGESESRERLPAAIVSGNYFDVLGIEPVQGRFFLPEEDHVEGTHPVTVISYGLWRRMFQGDPHVVGQKAASPAIPLRKACSDASFWWPHRWHSA